MHAALFACHYANATNFSFMEESYNFLVDLYYILIISTTVLNNTVGSFPQALLGMYKHSYVHIRKIQHVF